MKAERLAGLEPANVFGYFEKLCSIPHGSGDTKKISDYLVSFAQEHGIRYEQDHLNNVLMFQDATPGYEDHEPVILQGHMDMVCEKDADCKINFLTDGLDVTHDDHDVYANGTTLGGDDGIAVAFALAVLADTSIPHPALEVIFTVDEETGMFGAAGVDMSRLKSRQLINIDSEEEGIFTVSCAGGIRSYINLPAPRHAVYGPCIRLKVEGLAGGHSGMEIDKNRANANKVMGEFLSEVRKLMPLCLTSIEGGTKDNAIPRSCTASLVAMGMDLEPVNEIAAKLQEKIRSEYAEPEACISADNVDALGGNAMTTQDTDKVIGLLCGSPDGVIAKNGDMLQTSLNLGIVVLEDSEFKMSYCVRSSVNREKVELVEKLEKLAQMYDCKFSTAGDYPAWEYREQSHLRDVLVSEYRNLFHKDPEIVSIHAGLECGLFSEKLPGVDCISFGPQLHDVHTSRERLEIESTARTWEFLKAILKAL